VGTPSRSSDSSLDGSSFVVDPSLVDARTSSRMLSLALSFGLPARPALIVRAVVARATAPSSSEARRASLGYCVDASARRAIASRVAVVGDASAPDVCRLDRIERDFFFRARARDASS
jgi:hypothetical protein